MLMWTYLPASVDELASLSDASVTTVTLETEERVEDYTLVANLGAGNFGEARE